MTRPDPIDTHVGQVIRRSRLGHGLSMEQLAVELGITYQQVQKYESGANRVSASTLYRIAAALDMAVGSFFPASDADAAAQGGPSKDDLRACVALERIEDERVRVTMRKLIGALAADQSERR